MTASKLKKKPDSVDEVCKVALRAVPRSEDPFPAYYFVEFQSEDQQFPVGIRLPVDVYQDIIDKYGLEGKGQKIVKRTGRYIEMILYFRIPYRREKQRRSK